jgi:hypothetical protein
MQIEKLGLLEQIQTAVQPLIKNGDFHLEPVGLKYYDADVSVWLTSTEMDMIFQSRLRHRACVDCYLKVHSVKKLFISEYLFPALNINLLENTDNHVRDFSSIIIWDTPVKNRVPGKYQVEFEYLLAGSGFIGELYRQCFAMNERLPEIQNIFSSDKIDETIRLYLLELKKHGRFESLLELKNIT